MQDRIRERLGRICSSVPLTCDSLTGTAAKIWIIQEDCCPVPKADLVIANLVAEYIGVARLVQMVKASQANWLDLIYMRENIEEDGALFIRLDFRAIQ